MATRFLLLVAALLLPVVPAAAAAAPDTPRLPLSLGNDGTKTAPTKAVAAAPGDRIQRSTARSHDVTGDGWPDILARQPGLNNGTLWAYTHSRQVQGTSTFSAKTMVLTGANAYNWIGVAEVTGDTDEYETAHEKPADLLVRRASDGALLVMPHSGRLNGTSTWGTPVQVGYSWNGLEWISTGDVNVDGYDDILAYDDNTGRLYVYLHIGKFIGVGTFRSALLLNDGADDDGIWVDNFTFMTEWSRENPDLGAVALGEGTQAGEAVAIRHLNRFTGGIPWDVNEANKFTITGGQFPHDTTYCVFLIDVNGDGLDDIVKSMSDGKLMYYPFRGWGTSPGLGSPVQIGTGWQVMDLLT